MFSFKPKRILYRIILPFTLLFAITTILSWLFSSYLITRYLDLRLKKQMGQVAGVMSRSSYISNPAILCQLKGVINADIALFSQVGRLLGTTFSGDAVKRALGEKFLQYGNDPATMWDAEFGGKQYRGIIHPIDLPGEEQAFLSLWIPADEAKRLTGGIVLGMGLISILGILAMTGIGYIIARTITAPIEKLVEYTGKVSGGDLNNKIDISGRDEISKLSISFNKMTEQLRDYENKLVETEKLATAGRMAAGMAHEVRNPLTGIKMMSQVLYNRLKTEPENQEVLGSLIKEIDRLDRIIEEIINRTRPGELSRVWGDINDQANEVVSLAGQSLTEQKITISTNLAHNLPALFLDREKIKQVLWNLILNGKEAMPKGGCLAISTGICGDRWVELSVEDSGQGIVPEDVGRLFQPFFTTKPEGVGLGLTMSRKIVEKHGGRLTLANRPEGGVKATVLLPINKNPDNPVNPNQA